MPTRYNGQCPILLEIDFSRFSQGKGFWKMNNSLLKDSKYVEIIKNIIKRVTCQYARNKDTFAVSNEVPSYTIKDIIAKQTQTPCKAYPPN